MVFVSCKKDEILIVDATSKAFNLDNGVLKFEDSPFTGKLVSHFQNGQIQSEIFYTEGRKQGSEKQWFQDGALALERFYNQGVKVGIHKAWWQNGAQKFVYTFNNKGEFHGNVKEWYADGKRSMDFNYKNGKESGSQKLWKIDGSIKSNYEVIDGERFGLVGLKKCFTVTKDSDEIK